MHLESGAAKASKDFVDNAKKVTETTIRNFWTILDAASEKKAPSEYLNQKAINAIQGNTQA